MITRIEDMTIDTFPITPTNRANYNIAKSMLLNHTMFRLVVFDLPASEGFHMKHAIQNFWRGQVDYFSTTIADFVDDLINAVMGDMRPIDMSKYETPDILIVDDLQHITCKDATQEAFYRILKKRLEARKLTIIFADRPLHQLWPGISKDLVSLIQMGLADE